MLFFQFHKPPLFVKYAIQKITLRPVYLILFLHACALQKDVCRMCNVFSARLPVHSKIHQLVLRFNENST